MQTPHHFFTGMPFLPPNQMRQSPEKSQPDFSQNSMVQPVIFISSLIITSTSCGSAAAALSSVTDRPEPGDEDKLCYTSYTQSTGSLVCIT